MSEAVLLNLKSGVYFALGLAGIRNWQLLPGHELLSEIAEVIVAQIGRHPRLLRRRSGKALPLTTILSGVKRRELV